MVTVKLVAKNSLTLFLLRIFQFSFSAVLSIYTARLLGTVGFGKFTFALSFTTFFLVFADFGLSIFAIREVSRLRGESSERIETLVGNSLLLKAVLSVPVYAAMVGIVNLLGYPDDTKKTVYLLGLSILLESFTLLFTGVFRGLEKMEYEAISYVWEKPIIFLVGVWLLTKGYGIVSLAMLFLGARLLTLLIASLIYATKIQWLKFEKNRFLWKDLMVEILPFGIFLIAGTVYFQIDTIMLSVFQGDEAVGFFESAIRLGMVLMIIPEVFSEALFPAFSRLVYLQQDLTGLYRKALKLMLLVGFPIAVGLSSLADRVICLLYGTEYLPAVPALKLVSLMIGVRFLAYVPGVLLTSIDKQSTRMFVVAICAGVNVMTNLLVIPRWGFVGAAFDTLLTNFILLGSYIFIVWRNGFTLEVCHWNTGMRILASVGILYGFICIFREWSLFALVPVGAGLYTSSLVLLGAVRRDERIIIQRLFASRVNRS